MFKANEKIQYEKEFLVKILSNTCIEDKYILIITSHFYYRTPSIPIKQCIFESKVKISYSDGTDKIIRTQSIHPTSVNRSCYTMTLKKKKEYYECGIPLMFDTFDELSSITSIELIWIAGYDMQTSFKRQEGETDRHIDYFSATYDVSFTDDKDKHIYHLDSSDRLFIGCDDIFNPFVPLDVKEKAKRYWDRFSRHRAYSFWTMDNDDGDSVMECTRDAVNEWSYSLIKGELLDRILLLLKEVESKHKADEVYYYHNYSKKTIVPVDFGCHSYTYHL